jgi:DNA-binding GntR family transcriptional regulator
MAEISTDATVGVGRNTLVDLATQALRDELVAGRFAAGSRIHLRETATRLGMSQIPVREALRALATEGLVISLPHRGYRVAEASLADLEDTYCLRLVLDTMAVELAVPKLTDEDIARAGQALDDLERALRNDEWEKVRLANRRFHFAVYEAADSPWLLKFIAMLWESSEKYQRLASPQRGTLEQRVGEHRRILNACRQRDAAKAAELMHRHLNRTYTIAMQRAGGSV